jgi:hypothetical protein
MPVGAYVPSFTRVFQPEPVQPVVAVPETPLPAVTEAPVTTVSSHAQWRLAIAITLVAAVALVGYVLRPRSSFEQFWAPVLATTHPVLVAAAYAPVYLPQPVQGVTPAGLPSSISDFAVLNDQYVGGGDLLAVAQIIGMLGRMSSNYTLRIGDSVSFNDLRGTTTILIGYSSTQWAPVTRDFRFFLDDSDRAMIRDNNNPTDWYPHHLTRDYHTDEDYAIISRVFDPQTHAIVVLITGCTQYGTEAAANVITNPDLLSDVLRGAPKDWQRKNLQIVLQMKVIANSPANPKVIASYYW